MGYTTDFEGSVKTNKPVDKKTFDLINNLANTRRMKRAGLPVKYGVDGEFYCVDDYNWLESKDSVKEGILVDHNIPPCTQPGLWLQWVMKDDRQTIEWDGGEKFYAYVEWMKYIIDKILAPKGYVVNGTICWSGEEVCDNGKLIVKNNKVSMKGF